MPRDGSGIYTTPAGTTAVPDTTIESSKYNANVADVAADLNAARPIVAGGTGATSATAARTNIGAEVSTQVVTNYDTHPWEAGSFKSAPGATAAPDGGVSVISGICHIYDGGAMALEAYVHGIPAIKYTRTRWSTWQPWVRVGTDADYVNVTGDTMTGHLALPAGPAATNAVRKDYVDAADATKLPLAGGTIAGDLFYQGKLIPTNTTETEYTIDATQNTRTAANGALVCVIENFSGVIFVTAHSIGVTEIFVCGGGAVSKTGSTAAGTPSISLAYASAQGGYALTNITGSTQTFGIMAFRNRTSA